MHGGLASALWHEGKPIGFFAEEPFRIEPFGLGPASAVVVGAVEVEQNAPALGEPVAPTFELFADDGGHGREEDRKSTRLNSVTNAHLVCRLLLEKKNNKKSE